MTDINDDILEAVKKNLGHMEVQVIQQLADDSRELAEVRKTADYWESEHSDANEKYRVAESKRDKLEGEVEALNKELSHAQESMREMARKQAVLDYLMEDRERMFDILGGAYKERVTRTRQEVVGGGSYQTLDYSTTPPTPMTTEHPDTVQDVTDTTVTE